MINLSTGTITHKGVNVNSKLFCSYQEQDVAPW